MRDRYGVLPPILFAVLGVGAAFLLVPKGELDQEARLTGLSQTQALALLNATQEPLSPRLAFRRAELTAAAGDGLLADRLLADLTARTEQTAVIAAARADLAMRRGDVRQAAEYLAAAQARALSDRQRQKLADVYRQLGERAEERKILSAVPLIDLTGSERVRLVDLIAAEGARAEALEVARSALPLAGQNAPALAERFAALALSAGQPELLAQTAYLWVSKQEGEAVVMSMIKALTARPRIAKTFATAVVSKAPEARGFLAKAFTEVRLYDVARLLIQPWKTFGSMTDGGWEAVIFYADRSGDISPLEHLLQQMQPQEKPTKNAFLPLIRYNGAEAVLPYQHWLTPQYLESAPLVEAAWAVTRQRPDEAFTALQRAARPGQDQTLWRALAQRLQDTDYSARLHLLAEAAFALENKAQSWPVYGSDGAFQ